MKKILVLGSDGLEWNTLSSPSIWNYNESGNWELGDASNILQHMRGYKISEMAGTTIRGKGAIKSGEQKIALINSGNNAGFNLVGNPYPSPIDWNKTAAMLPPTLGKSIYSKGKSFSDLLACAIGWPLISKRIKTIFDELQIKNVQYLPIKI